MATLDHATHAQVQAFAEAGDELEDQGDHRGAIAAYNEAWELLPEPKAQWNAATWLLAAIGDADDQGGLFNSARDA